MAPARGDDATDKTIAKLVAEVDRAFVRRHPEFKGKKLPLAEQFDLQREWNGMFVERTFDILRAVRDSKLEAGRLIAQE